MIDAASAIRALAAIFTVLFLMGFANLGLLIMVLIKISMLSDRMQDENETLSERLKRRLFDD